MQGVLDLGTESTEEALGQRWTFSRLFVRISARFRDWIAEREGDPFALLDRLWDRLPEQERLARLKKAEDLAEQLRCFSLAGPLAMKWIQTEAGVAELARLMLEDHHPDVTADQALLVMQAVGPKFGEILRKAQGQALPTDRGNGEAPARPPG